MSIYLSVDASDPTILASNKGWGDVGRWIDNLDAGEYPQLVHLREYGWSQEVVALRNQTSKAMDAKAPEDTTVADTVSGLLDLLGSLDDDSVVTINNGMGPDTEALRETKDAAGHEHAADGKFGSGGSSKSKAPNKGDESSADYVDAFNDKSQDEPTVKDANDANKELEDAESDYRLVPSEDGDGWEAMHVDDLTDQYGDNWTIDRDPLTGKLQAGDADSFHEAAQDLAKPENQGSWADALNDRDVTQADVDTLTNYVNDNDDNDDAIVPDDGKWSVMSKADLDDEYGEGWKIEKGGKGWEVVGGE